MAWITARTDLVYKIPITLSSHNTLQHFSFNGAGAKEQVLHLFQLWCLEAFVIRGPDKG